MARHYIEDAVNVAHGGTAVASRSMVNFTDGAGGTWAVTDVGASDRVDVAFTPAAAAGSLTLQYDFTVTVAQASIDTDVDGALAGLFPTTGKLLEVYLTGRTDEAVFVSACDMTVNNDGGANYNRAGISTSAGGSPAQFANAGQTAWTVGLPGASNGSNTAGAVMLSFPAYGDATLFKSGTGFYGNAQNATLGNYNAVNPMFEYESASALTRIKITPHTAGAKLVVGTRLMVWIRG